MVERDRDGEPCEPGQFQCLEHGLDGLFCWGKPRATVLIARGGLHESTERQLSASADAVCSKGCSRS
eukprot:symbB.v1.2.003021.t1/scaffold113.1/size324549/19